MKLYFDDADMDGQLQRTVAGVYGVSADVGEVLAVASRVTPGDYASWFAEWSAAAERAEETGDESAARGRMVSAWKAYLRASEYWRQSWFFLRHDLDDRRVQAGWQRHREAFRKALPCFPYAVEAVEIPFEGASMPGYLVHPDASGVARPIVIGLCGYDSTAEESWAETGYMAVARGYRFLAFEGPGQGGMLFEQRIPFRPDFEVVLASALDWLSARGLGHDKTALFGRSFAGYLAPRAASFEKRVAALICDPGQVEFTSRMSSQLGAEAWQRLLDGDTETEQQIARLLDGPRNLEFWGARMAAHGTTSLGDYFRDLARFTCEREAPGISCPTLVTEGDGDFASQSRQLVDLLTCDKTYKRFDEASGAGGHCEGMGATLFEEFAFNWLDGVLKT